MVLKGRMPLRSHMFILDFTSASNRNAIMKSAMMMCAIPSMIPTSEKRLRMLR